MAHTYSQLYLHFVFATKYRAGLITPEFRPRIEAYLTAIAQAEGHTVLAIYCMPDHVHLLLGYKWTQAIPDFMRILKANSSKWASDQLGMGSDFEWQDGYGVFSHGPKELDGIVRYIKDQPKHHYERDFPAEFTVMLKRYGIPFEEKYLFSPPI